jgi:hypothetical protein
LGPIGLADDAKNPKNIRNARMKFIVTPATRTRTRAHHFLAEKLSFAPASLLAGSSHLIRTKPPIGSQFRVYSVHSLSLPRDRAFGGIPMPNSSTFIPVSRAVRKCPISWMKTMKVKTRIVRRIPRRIVMRMD